MEFNDNEQQRGKLLCTVNTAQAWVRRNPLEEGEMLLSLTAADLAQLGEVSGEYNIFWRMQVAKCQGHNKQRVHNRKRLGSPREDK